MEADGIRLPVLRLQRPSCSAVEAAGWRAAVEFEAARNRVSLVATQNLYGGTSACSGIDAIFFTIRRALNGNRTDRPSRPLASLR